MSFYEFELADAQNTKVQTNQQSKRILLCADGYGLDASVSNGILNLAKAGKLSATSLIVDANYAHEGIDELQNCGIQLGLHLNLTLPVAQPGFCKPFKTVLKDAYLLRLPHQAIAESIRRQLELFTDITGIIPDYIDSYDHIHQLPVIRDCLFTELKKLPTKPWIRNTSMRKTTGVSWQAQLKAIAITAMGAAGLRYRADYFGYPQNSGFLGVYEQSGGIKVYENYMRNWLSSCRDGDVIMCQPANDKNGSANAQKQAEYAVLMGALMEHLIARNNLSYK